MKIKNIIKSLTPYLQFIGAIIGIIVNLLKFFPMKLIPKKTIIYISVCCSADVTIKGSPDFIGEQMNQDWVGTCNYYCESCGEPCDIKEKK